MSRMPNFGSTTNPLDYSSDRTDSGAVVAFFNSVYAWMATGLAVTGGVAWVVSRNEDLQAMVLNPVAMIVLVIAQLALVFTISAAVQRVGATAATALFLLYSALMGLTMSIIFLMYTKSSIASTFLVTAGTFGAMSVYGMTTKRDLSSWGSLLFMALIGLIIASVVNMFWANSTLYWIITYAGVLIFVGLTAYDTQNLKQIARATAHDAKLAARYSVNGALRLYLDFINLFLMLLRILGDRR